jgi:ABC-type branched-subunit amino acid transport system substrate-binding protein
MLSIRLTIRPQYALLPGSIEPRTGLGEEFSTVPVTLHSRSFRQARRKTLTALIAAGAAALLAGCGGFGAGMGSLEGARQAPQAQQAPPQPAAIGAGQVKVGMILPLSAGGNAGLAAQSMRNAAELALAEFNAPNVQLLVKDDGGTAQGAQAAAQQALDEGAEIILGPLFAHSVAPAGQVARTRNVPVIAFSTDATVATRGVYLLSFLPETDVERVVEYAVTRGNRRSFAALIPENAYGNVVEAAFRQAVARHGGRIVALERLPADRTRLQEATRRVAAVAAQADALFIPADPELLPTVVQSLAASGVNLKRLQLLGTGLWDDQRVFAEAALQGGLFAAPDGAGFRGFSSRYRAKYGQEPVRTATLSYDAVSLVAALVKTQGPQRFSEQVLSNPSGFSGIDGIFRFKADGTNERGLSVLRVTSSGGQVVAPPPKAFGGSGT